MQNLTPQRAPNNGSLTASCELSSTPGADNTTFLTNGVLYCEQGAALWVQA